MCSLFGERMQPFLEKWDDCSGVASFCAWLSGQLSEPGWVSLQLPDDITELLRRALENKGEKFFRDCLEFLYDENVRQFAREFSETVHPLVEVDLVSILKMIDKTRFSEALQKQLAQLAREEFGYMVDRFAATWDKNIGREDLMTIRKMPLRSLIEYDLTEALVTEIPQHKYWP